MGDIGWLRVVMGDIGWLRVVIGDYWLVAGGYVFYN